MKTKPLTTMTDGSLYCDARAEPDDGIYLQKVIFSRKYENKNIETKISLEKSLLKHKMLSYHH